MRENSNKFEAAVKRLQRSGEYRYSTSLDRNQVGPVHFGFGWSERSTKIGVDNQDSEEGRSCVIYETFGSSLGMEARFLRAQLSMPQRAAWGRQTRPLSPESKVPRMMVGPAPLLESRGMERKGGEGDDDDDDDSIVVRERAQYRGAQGECGAGQGECQVRRRAARPGSQRAPRRSCIKRGGSRGMVKIERGAEVYENHRHRRDR